MNNQRPLEHIGIAVKDMGKAKNVFQKLLGLDAYKTEFVESEGVETAFFSVGNTKIELLSAMNEESPIAKFLTKRKEGIHHIALNVIDLDSEIERLKNLGFEFINETPKEGADNKRIVFLHPKTTNGVLIELCMDQ